MSVQSQRSINIINSGEINSNQAFQAATNGTAPGDIDVLSLSAGANTITVPNIVAVAVARGATIIPPPGNAQTIILKGLTGDTGVPLHPTDPTSISFPAPPPASFVLTAGGTIDGLRIVWT